MNHSIYFEQLEEKVILGKPLGRSVFHDSRSKQYAFDTTGLEVNSVKHMRRIPVLDQGSLGSCTGNATVGALGTVPFNDTLTADQRALLTEETAVTLYSDATRIDNISGTYPPTDTGSNGVSVAKAAQRRGFISGYQHTFSLQNALKALQVTPVIVGVTWYEGFDNVAPNGLVKVSGAARGGHEFVVDEVDASAKLVGATNSWGTSWGLSGRFYFSWDDFGRLLSEKGDVTVFVPVTKPAPVPTPVPPPKPSSPDADLNAAMKIWQTIKSF